MSDLRDNYEDKIDKRLLIRQRVFVLIISILTIINVANIINEKIPVILAVSGFLFMLVIGLLFSRIFKIFWHQEKRRVVSRLDAVGIVLLVAYVILEIGKKWFFEHWLSGSELNAFVLLIISGLILGRFLGTLLKIKTILSKNK